MNVDQIPQGQGSGFVWDTKVCRSPVPVSQVLRLLSLLVCCRATS